MNPLRIPAGATVWLGAPAKPMSKSISDAIARLVSAIPGVIEAHLPQCFIAIAMKTPAQVLVLVAESHNFERILGIIGGQLTRILPTGMHLDIWPMEKSHVSLSTVRNAGCQIV